MNLGYQECKKTGLKLSIKGTNFFREFNCDICKADAQALLDTRRPT